ncbi:MAG: hypothetical protein J5921_05305 [Clostridia bacterium]|nr:hypothetical protein [Clostridia bacterium]
MKNRIRAIVIMCIVGCIAVFILSSCQKHEKRVFFVPSVSGSVMAEFNWEEPNEDLYKIIPWQNEFFAEENAPSEIQIDFVCPEMNSGNKFYYKESIKSGDLIKRSYEYNTDSGRGWCTVSASGRKLFTFHESPKNSIIADRIANMPADAFLSENQCLEKAEKVLGCLYPNSDQFVLYETKQTQSKVDGYDIERVRYEFWFKREVEDVTISDVHITVLNYGDIEYVTNYDCLTNDAYDNSPKLDFRKALNDAEEAVNDKMKSVGSEYSATARSAKLGVGKNNQMLLFVEYGLKNNSSGFECGILGVYVIL